MNYDNLVAHLVANFGKVRNKHLPLSTNRRSSLSNWQGGASVGLNLASKALRSPESRPNRYKRN